MNIVTIFVLFLGSDVFAMKRAHESGSQVVSQPAPDIRFLRFRNDSGMFLRSEMTYPSFRGQHGSWASTGRSPNQQWAEEICKGHTYGTIMAYSDPHIQASLRILVCDRQIPISITFENDLVEIYINRRLVFSRQIDVARRGYVLNEGEYVPWMSGEFLITKEMLVPHIAGD